MEGKEFSSSDLKGPSTWETAESNLLKVGGQELLRAERGMRIAFLREKDDGRKGRNRKGRLGHKA